MLIEASSFANQEGQPIAKADATMLAGPLILDCTTAIRKFVRQMRSNGFPASMDVLRLQRRGNAVANQSRAPYFDGDQRPPCMLTTFAKDNPALEDTLSYYLSTPTVGWIITVRVEEVRQKFELYATVGFPFPESYPGDINAYIPQGNTANKRYKAFSRSVVFFFGDPWNQHYADSVAGIEPWLRHWLREITPL